MSFVCTQFKCQTVLIWPLDKTLSGATTLGLSGPGSDGYEEVLHIPQSSKTGASPSDGFTSYPGFLLGESSPSAERKSDAFYSPNQLGCNQKREHNRNSSDNSTSYYS